jgi:hypothetical protein
LEVGFSWVTTSFWGVWVWGLGLVRMEVENEGFVEEGLRDGLKSGKLCSTKCCGCSIHECQRTKQRKCGLIEECGCWVMKEEGGGYSDRKKKKKEVQI